MAFTFYTLYRISHFSRTYVNRIHEEISAFGLAAIQFPGNINAEES